MSYCPISRTIRHPQIPESDYCDHPPPLLISCSRARRNRDFYYGSMVCRRMIQVLDQVVAIVDDDIILTSELQDRVAALEALWNREESIFQRTTY